jgi:hypothetical protein
MKKILHLAIFISWNIVSAQTKTTGIDFLKNLLFEKASPQLKYILQHPDSFRYQVIYTRIDRDKLNQPHFFNYYYNTDRNSYFNPASTVKMPLAFLALEKINHLKKYGVNKNTTMLTDSAYRGQTTVLRDTSSANQLPSIAQYIRKIFLISDNDAYNRLYEFLGQQYINERLWQMGYKDIRITRRFVPMNEDQNRHTNPIRFIENGKLLYLQPPAYNENPFDFSKKILIGKAHYDDKDSLIQSPMDFTTHNNLPLEDLQHILQSVLFPASVPANERFDLTEDDYAFLYQYMSEYPSESKYPHYDTAEYFNSYTKFFMFKSGKLTVPSYIRIFNKPGWSFGFLTDAAYIADFKNKIEFIVSAVIYVNSDGILNDDKYEYEETGYPFFKELGNIIYEYELGRKRKYYPELKNLQLYYN